MPAIIRAARAPRWRRRRVRRIEALIAAGEILVLALFALQRAVDVIAGGAPRS